MKKRAISKDISIKIEKAFRDKMDKTYTLVYTDYRDSFEGNPFFIHQCLKKESSESIMDYQFDRFSYEAYCECRKIIDKLKEEIQNDASLSDIHPYIEEWLEDNRNIDTIRYLIDDRDDSSPVQEMIGRTSLRARATLFTNYDCLPHNFDMDNTYSYRDYFKDIVDVLCLNPARMKQMFNEMGIGTKGHYPNLKHRDGKEAIDYKEFAEELLNQSCFAHLVFMGMLPLDNLYNNDFKPYKRIVIPKGNLCGMFGFWQGGGSLMEMKLLRDLEVPVTRPRKTNYDSFRMDVDEPGCNGYSIDEVYGMCTSVWGEPFKLIY